VGAVRVGFISQVSPDGSYILSTFAGPAVKSLIDSYYVTNFLDYRFLQVFYPTRGILEYYDRKDRLRHPLPGADDPKYVQTDGVWSRDGNWIVFARALARDPHVAGQRIALHALDENETQIQYDLYRIPFNKGKGGTPERIKGASDNGMSNNFPKISPDGKWIVFVQCKNGQLMRPDSQLYIVPFAGGTARRMRANTRLMNSWHSFSPNGRWLVFSSKARSPYTQMYLTHIDENGNDSPAILIDNATAANRAVNIPEFVNIAGDGIEEIRVNVADDATRLANAKDRRVTKSGDGKANEVFKR
jgi:Tol biopolymer transport system component